MTRDALEKLIESVVDWSRALFCRYEGPQRDHRGDHRALFTAPSRRPRMQHLLQ